MAFIEVGWDYQGGDGRLLIFASPNVSRGITRPPVESFKLVAHTALNNSPLDITADWQAIFGPLEAGVPGGAIWFGIIATDPGEFGTGGPFQSPMFIARALITEA